MIIHHSKVVIKSLNLNSDMHSEVFARNTAVAGTLAGRWAPHQCVRLKKLKNLM